MNEDDVNDIAMKLQELIVYLQQQDDAAGFLGVTLDCDEYTGLLEMKQLGLIKQVIETLVLDGGMSKGKFMPEEANPLVKDEDGESVYGTFIYSTVVGMILYVSGHTRPDVSFSVDFCT